MQVWKAMDKISDTGLHRYLQHHWVIFRLAPVDAPDSLSAHPDSLSTRPDSLSARPDSLSARPDSQAECAASEAPAEELAPNAAPPQNLAPNPTAGTSCPDASAVAAPEGTAWQHLPQKRNLPEEPSDAIESESENQNPRPQGRRELEGGIPSTSGDSETLNPRIHESTQNQAASNGLDQKLEESKQDSGKSWHAGGPKQQLQQVIAGVKEGTTRLFRRREAVQEAVAATGPSGPDAVEEATQEAAVGAGHSQPDAAEEAVHSIAEAVEESQPVDVAEAVQQVTEAAVAATAGLKQAGLALADQVLLDLQYIHHK